MKLGLVLAGGGGKGAYQIGALKALNELGVDKHVKSIAGTSIGALNAMLFIQDDIELGYKAWTTIEQEDILPIDKNDLIMQSKIKIFNTNNRINKVMDIKPELLHKGEFSREGIEKIIEETLDLDMILASDIKCYCTCSDLLLKDKVYFDIHEYPKEIVKKIILASSAIPGIYDAVDINGTLYLDGGLKDNVPVKPVYDDGCDLIIVIKLNAADIIDYDKYPNAMFIEIGLVEDEEAALKGLFDFSHETVNNKIELGYKTTMDLIKPIFYLRDNIK